MNIYYLAAIICSIFLLIKGLEFKYNKDENKNFKPIIIDTLYIFLSVVAADTILTQLQPIIKDTEPKVFIDNPSF